MTHPDLAAYLLDNYGTCKLGPDCYFKGCLGSGWLGQGCAHWVPMGCTTWEELKEAQRGIYRGPVL